MQAVFLSLPVSSLTVLQLYHLLRQVFSQVRFLSEFTHGLIHRVSVPPIAATSSSASPSSLDLLSRVYEGALLASNAANGMQPLLLALLSAALAPLLRCVADWIHRGDLTEADADFFVRSIAILHEQFYMRPHIS